VRGLVALDLGQNRPKADPRLVFDLGSSGASNIAKEEDAMIAEAFASSRKRSARR
jgi:hypothetical protein